MLLRPWDTPPARLTQETSPLIWELCLPLVHSPTPGSGWGGRGMLLRGRGGRLGGHGALGRVPSPWRSHRGLGDTTGGAGASPDTFISPPGSWRCLYFSVCQAVSACRPALNLPALGGFHPLPPIPSFHCPPYPPPFSAQLPLPSCWRLAPTPLTPPPGQGGIPFTPLQAFRRRATCIPLHRKPVSLHFAIFHFASLPPGDSNVSPAPQAPTRHNKRWAGASGSSQGTGGPLPTAGDRLHYSGQHLSFLKVRRGSRTKGRREGLVRSHQH